MTKVVAFAESASRGLLVRHSEEGKHVTAEEPSPTLGVAEGLKGHRVALGRCTSRGEVTNQTDSQ